MSIIDILVSDYLRPLRIEVYVSLRLSISLVVVCAASFAFAYIVVNKDELDARSPFELLAAQPDIVDPEEFKAPTNLAPKEIVYAKSETIKIKKGSTVYNTLREVGVSPQTIHNVVQTSRPVRNLAYMPPKTPITVSWINDTIDAPDKIVFKLSSVRSLVIDKKNDKWQANLIKAKIDYKFSTFSGLVTSSLWESATSIGLDPQIIIQMTEVFAWQIDFGREVRPGDRWRLTVLRKYVKEEPIAWGDIVAAEYENRGELYTAVKFRVPGKKVASYFFPDGRSLRRMFLKSPVKFGRISSKFSRKRFHPILKVRRPHLGVDYAAPTGTPILSVGEGVVTFARRNGGAGKMIKVRHNSTYKTAFKHLSRFAKGIRKGREVEQGEIIGYVGATGLATGPHLHFEFYEHGRFVDPLGKKFPSADPVPKKYLKDLEHRSKIALASLPVWHTEPEEKKPLKIAKSVIEETDK